MKAQVKMEFIFSLVFFAILLFYLSVQINTNVTTVITDSFVDSLKARGNSVIDILVKTPGIPENWEEETDISKIKVIGLASTPYNLSKSKINKLYNNCNLLNKTIKEGGYRLIIYNDKGELKLDCGYGGPEIKIVLEDPVYIEDEYGTIILEIW